jgi:hypothetical protein
VEAVGPLSMDGQGKLQRDSEGLLLKTNQIEERPEMFVKDYSVHSGLIFSCCNFYRPFSRLLEAVFTRVDKEPDRLGLFTSLIGLFWSSN